MNGNALRVAGGHHALARAAVQFLIVFGMLLVADWPARADSLAGPELIAALRAGGYVILMRHARSPNDSPDPAHANADNVSHERQLDEVGRSSARLMGEALRRLRIPIAHVLSSPTYRALETTKLMGVGTATTLEELGDGGHSMLADNAGVRAARLMSKVREPIETGTDTLIVTHFPNIREVFPESSVGLADGEALVLHTDGRGATTVVARVKMEEWSLLPAESPQLGH
jgi:phosphohistidine phosphatase SixA